jgi:hypothetical protein
MGPVPDGTTGAAQAIGTRAVTWAGEVDGDAPELEAEGAGEADGAALSGATEAIVTPWAPAIDGVEGCAAPRRASDPLEIIATATPVMSPAAKIAAMAPRNRWWTRVLLLQARPGQRFARNERQESRAQGVGARDARAAGS